MMETDDNSKISIPVRDMASDRVMDQPKEQTIQFNRFTDKKTISVDTESGEKVAQISGYGLEVGFNYKYFKSREDIETAADSIAALIIKIVMDTMIQQANEKVNQQTQ